MTIELQKNVLSVCTIESLGKRVYEQKASTANLIAGIILGILMIVSVEETIAHERLPIVKGPARHLLPTKTSRAYLVRRCDAKEFFFNSNVLSRPSLLAGPLATAAEARGIPWRTREVTD